jgi:hypothetical protein
MASPDRMEVHDNSSDGESSDEENPQQLQDKARRLALALGQKWDAAVARKRLAINKDDLPGGDARRNTAELMADLRRLRQMTRSATDSSSSSIGVGAAEAGADSRELGRR